jgi:hypothetical protein
VVTLDDPADRKGRLKEIGGSRSDSFNSIIGNQAMAAIWTKNSDTEERGKQYAAAAAALAGIAPRDEIEGMLGAQLVAAHNAALECFRRAMIDEQTFQGRSEALTQANKLVRSFATLVETLNRHRGKSSQQKIVIEHIGQAAFIANGDPGEGVRTKTENQPHALGYAPGQTLWSENPPREPLSIASDGERPLLSARRPVDGSTEG